MKQVVIIMGCLLFGEFVVYLTGIKMPSSIIGMLLLTLSLEMGWIKLEWVKGISNFLTKNMAFFFVPPGVAIMLYLDLIKASFWPIIVASTLGTVIVFACTGWTHQLFIKHKKTFKKNKPS
ncbi:CidA/LrgA family protein [Formosa algae]|uniref:Holin-like protein n=1 Tax=Formosa algae TaxID=225843 RepID=A0A9X0YLY4_9FLAO|nr:CidA/LrgA family protein [Formosa algae]MBP1839654.1 holin-like protein [Formosa algae]MDQ0334958.1 holin-like protein [Formosa algae]OEI81620.1 murein hydrolase transporter LrgA [Formosa algae]PNW28910.1 CidA/LrgA family protein [Formosa algae]